jgi:transcriptional regulator
MSTTKQRQQIEWRRNQVLDLLSKGFTQSHIAIVLKIDKSVVSRDVFYLRQQSKENIRKYVNTDCQMNMKWFW